MSSSFRLSVFGILMLWIFPLFIHAQMPRITVQGNEFVNDVGVVFVFRGYSSSDPENLLMKKSWNVDYFRELRDWGANVVRFPIHPRAWRSQGKEAYLKLLDQGVAWAEANELYVIMDWHSIGNLVEEKYLNNSYHTNLEETFDFWRVIAERFGDNPTVAFYELFNEPVNGGKLGELSWDRWKAIMEELINEVRVSGGDGIPLVAGFNWAYDLTPIQNQPIDAEKIAYVSHPYPQKRNKPWNEKWTEDWGFVKKNYPIVLTEIGYCTEDDPGAHIPVISDHSYGKAISQYADENKISYIVWVFDDSWSPRLYVDDQFTPSYQGSFWKEKLNGY